jgi:hypothetical protein
MIASTQLLSDPIVATVLRIVLGGCLIYMARDFYANPADSFRNSAQWMANYPWLMRMVRGLACFCLWGGCFIAATAIAVQIFGLYGDRLAVALGTLSAIATWLLLPKRPDASAKD